MLLELAKAGLVVSQTGSFGGSRLDLVMQALSATPTTNEELRQIRALLDSLPGETR